MTKSAHSARNLTLNIYLKIKAKEVMKKLSIAILTSVWLALFGFSTAQSGGIGIGFTGSYVMIDASGTESDANDAGTESSDRTAEVDNNAFLGSIYAEYAADNGFALGYEYYPGAADVSEKLQTRTDTETSVSGTAAETSNTRVFSANAEVENYSIIYAELPIGPLFVRAGYSQMDVNTTEVKSGNGGSYGNTSIDGTNLGAGFKGVWSDNVRWKIYYEMTNWDDISLSSTGNSADSGANSITADLDTSEVKFALGFQF